MVLSQSLLATVNVKADGDGILTTDLACAATTFLVWDTLINLDDEVEYIWRGPNCWTKWMYIFIRHGPYLAQGVVLTLAVTVGRIWENSQCRAWIGFEFAFNEVLTVAVEIILIARIYAMFYRSWWITITLYALFIGEIVSMCTILAITVPKIEFTPQCLVVRTPSLFTSYWTISLAFETTLFVLTLVKFFSIMALGQVHRRSIMLMLTRDGAWAYATIFVIMLLNTLMYDIEKNTLSGICYYWELSVMSFTGSHVLLNLRKFALEDSGSTGFTNTGTHSPRRLPLSDLRFNDEITSAGTTVNVMEMETFES